MIGWFAVFAGLGLWGLVVGLAATIVVLSLVREASVRHSFSVMAAFSFAFILLSWPVLWPDGVWMMVASPHPSTITLMRPEISTFCW